MPTINEARAKAREFARARSQLKTLADRMKWWGHVLGIDNQRLLMLMGAPATKTVNWTEIARQWPDKCAWLDDILGQLVAMFDYDWRAFSSYLHDRSQPEKNAKPEAEKRLRGPSQPDKVLLSTLAEGGPLALQAVLRFLAGSVEHGRNSRRPANG